MTLRTLPLLLVLAACGAKDKDRDTDALPDTDPADTDVEPVLCGNDTLDDGEQCDFGPLNAADGNCLLDCTLSDTQVWTVSLSDLPLSLVDAVGTTFSDAPAGTGAWSPADTDLNNDGLVKLNLNAPLYDPRQDAGFALLQLPSFPLDKISADDPIGVITLADIADVQFDARFPEGQRPQFYLYLYTMPDGQDDGDTWYGHKLRAFTGDADTPEPAADTWTRYSVTGPNHQFTFWDPDVTGKISGSAVPLSTLTALSAFNWAEVDDTLPATAIDYGAEQIKYVSIQTSSGAATSEFDGAIDNVRVLLKDGRSFTVDLEP